MYPPSYHQGKNIEVESELDERGRRGRAELVPQSNLSA
jgi:hypothetical protein